MSRVDVPGEHGFRVVAFTPRVGAPSTRPRRFSANPRFDVTVETEFTCELVASHWDREKAVAAMESFVAEAQAALDALRTIEPTRESEC